MKLSKLAGATSEIWQVFIRDSSSSTGAGLTGLTNASSGLTAYYHRDTDTTATAISLVTMTVGTFTSSGFKEIDATNMPGWYQFCPPNAALAAGAKSCGFHLKGATNMAPLPIEVQLQSFNVDDAVRGGLTALPNAVPGAAGGIFIAGTNAPVTITGAGDALTISSTGTNGNGINLSGNGSGDAVKATAGATGKGLEIIGGSSSGAGISITTTSGNGLDITPTAGHAINATANGTTKHGINATGGATSSDGIRATGGGTGSGLNVQSGSGATGNGLTAVANSTNGNGIGTTATGTGVGFSGTLTNISQIAGDATAATNLAAGADGVVPGTAQTGSTTTVIQTDLTSSVTDVYVGRAITITTGTNAGAASNINAYNGTTKAITVSPALAGAPANGDKFAIT